MKSSLSTYNIQKLSTAKRTRANQCSIPVPTMLSKKSKDSHPKENFFGKCQLGSAYCALLCSQVWKNL